MIWKRWIHSPTVGHHPPHLVFAFLFVALQLLPDYLSGFSTHNRDEQHIAQWAEFIDNKTTEYAHLISPADHIDEGLMRRRLLNVSSTDSSGMIRHPHPHFFVHTPKTGGAYAFAMLIQMLFQAPDMHALAPEDMFRICDTGTKLDFIPSHGGVDCTMWMAEHPYEDGLAGNSYAVVRNPREHVLSQYLHCTESKVGYGDWATKERKEQYESRKARMPSLDVWLEAWVDAMGNETKAKKNADFGCPYDPRNLQSRYSAFDAGGYSPLVPLEEFAVADIQRKFTVIGSTEDMDKVLCAAFVHYTGWTPGFCVCSASENNRREGNGHHHLKLSHGVKNHGSSYPTTKHQDGLIQKLVQSDLVLHQYAKELFDRQVRVIESEYNVTLCDKVKRGAPWKFK